MVGRQKWVLGGINRKKKENDEEKGNQKMGGGKRVPCLRWVVCGWRESRVKNGRRN